MHERDHENQLCLRKHVPEAERNADPCFRVPVQQLPDRSRQTGQPSRRERYSHFLRCNSHRGISQGSRAYSVRRRAFTRVPAVGRRGHSACRRDLLQYADLPGNEGRALAQHLSPPLAEESRPKPRMRTMVGDLFDASSLPKDIPNLKSHTVSFTPNFSGHGSRWDFAIHGWKWRKDRCLTKNRERRQ